MANFKIGKAIKERDTISRQEATDFITLHEVEWTEKMSSIAHQTTKQKRFNKKDMLSVTEDVISLQKFLVTKFREYTALQNTEKPSKIGEISPKFYFVKWNLSISQGEMKRHEIKMLLAKFLDRANCWQCNSEIVNTLQTLEQEMLNGILSIIFLKIYFKCSIL